VCDIVVKRFTFAISSPDEFLLVTRFKRHTHTITLLRFYVACRPLVSHGEYADEIDRVTDGHTDGHQTVTLHFPLDADSNAR